MNLDSMGMNRKRREPLELQLTAMIDVFSMIVIFLIFGTVFGAADMVIPNGMRIPNSLSKEGIEAAPRVSIENGEVKMSLLEKSFSLASFRTSETKVELKKLLEPTIMEYQKKRKESVAALNLVADRDTAYQDVFDVVATFRELGFNTILFVASGVAKGKAP